MLKTGSAFILFISLWLLCSEVQAATGTLIIEIEPEAMVFVDGIAVSAKPVKKTSIPVDVGEHQISSEVNGYEFEVMKATVAADGTTKVFLSLVKSNQNRDAMTSVSAGEYEIGMEPAKVKWVCKGVTCEKEYMLAQPNHSVKVNAFSIDKYEVTNRQYKKFMQAAKQPAPKHWAGGEYPEKQDDYPVANVSWNDAAAYCKWAGKRLPTEVEWEVAARGGKKLPYPWGQKYRSGMANVARESYNSPTITGRYERGKSHLDCYDMIGNVWEWTASNPSNYAGAPAKIDQKSLNKIVVRGGSFRDAEYMATTPYRKFLDPNGVFEDVGFRCAK